MAFTLGGVLCLLLWRRHRRRALLVGGLVAIGLARGTKFSAGAAVIGSAVCMATLPAPWWRRAVGAFTAVAVPLVVFVVVNPHLWLHPVTRTLAMTEQWSRVIAAQQRDPFLRPLCVTDRWQALRLTLSRVVLDPAHGTGTPGFAGLVPRVVVALLVCAAVATLIIVVLRMTGRELRRRQLALSLGCAAAAMPVAFFTDALAWLVGALILLGAWRIGRRAVGPERHQAVACFAAIYVVVLVATVMWLPFDWPRYYLPLVALTPVLGAAAAVEAEVALASAGIAARA
jgi:hypothetical protein